MRCCSGYDDKIAFGVGKGIVVYRTSDLAKGREIVRMGFDAYVFSVAISPCGTLVVSGMDSGLVEMRSLVDVGFKRVFQGHANLVRMVLFSLCGSFLISGSSDSTVKIWVSATGVCQATVDCGSWVYGLALLPGGREPV